LDTAGFDHVGITLEATWQPLSLKVLTNATFNASVAAVSEHYPCTQKTAIREDTQAAALKAHKKFWAGEDTPTNGTDWAAAGCWGRKLNQHWVYLNATSTVSWAVAWSQYTGASLEFSGNGLLNASEPWSGHYEIPGTIWMMAHWHQFVQPDTWQFLENTNATSGNVGGSGLLAEGGSYVTLVPVASEVAAGVYPAPTFTMIVETLQGSCGMQGKCNALVNTTKPQAASFKLKGALAATKEVHLWCSSEAEQFVSKGSAVVTDGVFTMTVEPDTICTVTTLSKKVTKGQHPPAPPSAPFPATHTDTFETYTDDTQAWGFSDMYGSFAVRDKALTQVATAVPTGWAPVNYDPLTFIGRSYGNDVHMSASAVVNHTSISTQSPAGSTPYIQLCGGCGGIHSRGIKFGCPSSCCFNMSWTGEWIVGGGSPTNATGKIAGFKDVWHDYSFSIKGGRVTVAVDGVQVADVANSCALHGLAALGTGKYHSAQFKAFALELDDATEKEGPLEAM